jgi:hypothetical protein
MLRHKQSIGFSDERITLTHEVLCLINVTNSHTYNSKAWGIGLIMTGWSWYINSFPRSFWGWPDEAETCKWLEKFNNNKNPWLITLDGTSTSFSFQIVWRTKWSYSNLESTRFICTHSVQYNNLCLRVVSDSTSVHCELEGNHSNGVGISLFTTIKINK